MNNLINSVQLIGRLGASPELKTTPTGTKVSNVRFATNEYFKNNRGEWVEITLWHNLVFWGTLAESVESKCKKGSRLFVQGSLIYRDYTDVNNIKREVTDIRIHQFILLDGGANNPLLSDAAQNTGDNTAPDIS